MEGEALFVCGACHISRWRRANLLCYEFIRTRMIKARRTQEQTIGRMFMRGFLTVSSLALVASFGVSLSAGAATKFESWEGTWHLNKKETVYPKGVMVTDNDLVVSKDDGNKLTYVETVVANGKT